LYWAILDSNEKPQRTANKEVSENSENQHIHNHRHILANYPELEAIIIAWPGLSERTKQAIKALIESHRGK
jgi:hypothetical protein